MLQKGKKKMEVASYERDEGRSKVAPQQKRQLARRRPHNWHGRSWAKGQNDAGGTDSTRTKLFSTSASVSLKRLPQPFILIQAAAGKLAWAGHAGETWFLCTRTDTNFSAASEPVYGWWESISQYCMVSGLIQSDSTDSPLKDSNKQVS